MVLFIEGDPRTNDQCLSNTSGANSRTAGDWTKNTPYPICNPEGDEANKFAQNYQVMYYPNMYFISAKDKKVKKVDQYTASQLEDLLKDSSVGTK
jgi:hypothetical protein